MQNEEKMNLTRAEISEIVATAVEDTLIKLGVAATDPLEMQRDFQFVRDFRKASESIQQKGVVVIMTILLSGCMAAIWIGLKKMAAIP